MLCNQLEQDTTLQPTKNKILLCNLEQDKLYNQPEQDTFLQQKQDTVLQPTRTRLLATNLKNILLCI